MSDTFLLSGVFALLSLTGLGLAAAIHAGRADDALIWGVTHAGVIVTFADWKTER